MGSLARTAELEDDPRYIQLRESNKNLLGQLSKQTARTSLLVDAAYRAAMDAMTVRGAAKIPPKPPRDRRKAKDEVALIHATDWQVGKITATYNSDIAEQRLVTEMPERVERLTNLHRTSIPVRRAACLFGGDMVEGIMIFPGQPYAIDATLFDQTFHVADIMEKQILRYLSIYDEIDVYVEKGNHGRIGMRGDAPAGDNIDLFAYRICMERFRHEPRVHWHPLPPPGIFHRFSIGNYKALLFHGDEVKSAMGNIPQFAILKRVTSWRSIWQFHDAYGGHFHTPFTAILPGGGNIFMTGSPESDNDFATEYMGSLSMPSQRMHFVAPERGLVTAEYRLHFNYQQNVD